MGLMNGRLNIKRVEWNDKLHNEKREVKFSNPKIRGEQIPQKLTFLLTQLHPLSPPIKKTQVFERVLRVWRIWKSLLVI
jgi:hypothetical protein